MKFQINITKDILKRSMMCGTEDFQGLISKNCPIALAIRDLFPDATTGAIRIEFNNDSSRCIDLPFEAKYFINRFDELWRIPEKRLNLPEFSFEIDVPEEYLPTVDISEIQEILKNSSSLQLMI